MKRADGLDCFGLDSFIREHVEELLRNIRTEV